MERHREMQDPSWIKPHCHTSVSVAPITLFYSLAQNAFIVYRAAFHLRSKAQFAAFVQIISK